MPSEASPADVCEHIAEYLRGFRFHYGNEDDLQRGIEEALSASGAEFTREARLPGVFGRLDFMVHAKFEIGIEVKVEGASSSVGRQVARYLKCPEVEGIILVSSKRRHRKFPNEFGGKPVQIVWLGDGAA
jgi:hypothetical protein